MRASVKLRIFNATVIGRQNIPTKGPVIIASNHLSYADPPYLWGALRGRVVVAIAMKELWKTPFLGQLLWLMGFIPVDRKDKTSGKKAIQMAQKVVKAGGVLIIYPEGKISTDGNLHNLRAGVWHLAIETGAPVVPVGVKGTPLVWPLGEKKRDRRQPVEHNFGLPMYAKNYKSMERFLTVLRNRIAKLSGQELADDELI